MSPGEEANLLRELARLRFTSDFLITERLLLKHRLLKYTHKELAGCYVFTVLPNGQTYVGPHRVAVVSEAAFLANAFFELMQPWRDYLETAPK